MLQENFRAANVNEKIKDLTHSLGRQHLSIAVLSSTEFSVIHEASTPQEKWCECSPEKCRHVLEKKSRAHSTKKSR